METCINCKKSVSNVKGISEFFLNNYFYEIFFLCLEAQSYCYQKPYEFYNYMAKKIKENIAFLI